MGDSRLRHATVPLSLSRCFSASIDCFSALVLRCAAKARTASTPIYQPAPAPRRLVPPRHYVALQSNSYTSRSSPAASTAYRGGLAPVLYSYCCHCQGRRVQAVRHSVRLRPPAFQGPLSLSGSSERAGSRALSVTRTRKRQQQRQKIAGSRHMRRRCFIVLACPLPFF